MPNQIQNIYGAVTQKNENNCQEVKTNVGKLCCACGLINNKITLILVASPLLALLVIGVMHTVNK